MTSWSSARSTVRGVPYVLRIMGAGLREPKNRVPGTDIAGHVESVGANVKRFRPGDEVFGEIVKGNQWRNGGAYAEYAGAPESALALKPKDFTKSGERYDLILDIASNRSWPDCRRALTPDGTYVLIEHDHFDASSNRWIGSMGRFLKLLVLSPFDRWIPGVRSFKDPEGDPLAIVTGFIEGGRITPVVDSTFPLSEVGEAIRHMEAGHARGKIVITV